MLAERGEGTEPSTHSSITLSLYRHQHQAFQRLGFHSPGHTALGVSEQGPHTHLRDVLTASFLPGPPQCFLWVEGSQGTDKAKVSGGGSWYWGYFLWVLNPFQRVQVTCWYSPYRWGSCEHRTFSAPVGHSEGPFFLPPVWGIAA